MKHGGRHGVKSKTKPPCIIASQLSLNQPKSVRICLTLVKSTSKIRFFFKRTFPFGVGAKRQQLLCEKKKEAVLQLPQWWHLYRVAGGKGYALSVVSARGQRRSELVCKLEAKSVK